MEAVFIYLLKSSGLIAMFFLAYHFLVRKETFFNTNRWFLLTGLLSAAILPLLFIKKKIWVDPSPTVVDFSRIPIATPTTSDSFEINWHLVFFSVYGIGILLFLLKLLFDFYSLSKVLSGKTIEQQSDFKLVNVSENISPFSYFNYIVYNAELYSDAELENILEHEKVHSAQNHSIDVIISRLFCIVFWFNPLVWFYKKAIEQNLEFIADSEALKNLTDKKAYQITLLKITTQENCVAISNQFYQSLIKKRIVMLNRNQSKKRNSWKYALVLPLLAAFVIFFQVKVIAQERVVKPTTVERSGVTENSVDVYEINKNTTDAELQEKSSALKEKYDLQLVFSGVERNGKNELTALAVTVKKGTAINKNIVLKDTDAIKAFGIIVSKNEAGLLTVDFGKDDNVLNKKSELIAPNAPLVSGDKEIYIDGIKSSQADVDRLNPSEIATMHVDKIGDKSSIRIVTKKDDTVPEGTEIYINDEKISKEAMDGLDPLTIESMQVNKQDKNIRIVTKSKTKTFNGDDMPEPPTPPTPPLFTLNPPKAPNFPKAPKAPKGDPTHGDKKAWKEFEAKMAEFEKKMEVMEPDMANFEQKMAEFEKKMEPFTLEMNAFEKKMKAYEKQVEAYERKINAKK